jgi:hypothetical protein
MKVKRLLATAVATTMILGSSMVAFAQTTTTSADIVDNGKGVYTTSVTTNTSFQAPIVKVVVPTATPVYLNPYGIATTIDAVTGVNAVVTNSRDQIVSAEYLIHNYSNVPVKIDAAFTTTVTGCVLLAGDATTTDLKTKWVQAKVTITDAATASNKIEMDLAHKYSGKDTDVRPTLTLPAGTDIVKTEGVISGTPADAKLKYSGSVNSPANVTTAWTDTDALKIVIKYDIYPQVQAAGNGG